MNVICFELVVQEPEGCCEKQEPEKGAENMYGSALHQLELESLFMGEL